MADQRVARRGGQERRRNLYPLLSFLLSRRTGITLSQQRRCSNLGYQVVFFILFPSGCTFTKKEGKRVKAKVVVSVGGGGGVEFIQFLAAS